MKIKIFSGKVKSGKFSTESEKFFGNSGGNLKQGGNASLPQGMDTPVARQPQDATSIIQAITSEGLAHGPYMAATGGVEPATFRTERTNNHHLTNHAPMCHHQIEIL